MIRRPYSYAIYLVVLIFCFSSLAWAEVEKTVSKTLKLESKPIDMAVSADGKFTFILAEGGKVLIYDSSGERVLLSSEIEVLEKYLKIQELRQIPGAANNALKVSGQLGGVKVPPLILITLTENVFKHGIRCQSG